ncbi:hypothetical protein [Aurantibacter sp.]|uniref:hypothetical protein n=1 Tax=Aurantibacter sp. TaxID=2807103 RepID=UPI0032668E4A
MKKNENLDSTLEVRLNTAIEQFAWRQLSLEENQVLYGIVKNPSENIDFQGLNYLTNESKLMLMEKFRELGLLDTVRDKKKSVPRFIFHSELPKKLLAYIEKVKKSTNEHFSQSFSRLSFELLKNPYYRKKGNSAFRGTFTIKEDYTLKAGTKCAYAVYPRENGNCWLSLTPINDVLLMENRTFEKEPLHISSVLDRFFENKI